MIKCGEFQYHQQCYSCSYCKKQISTQVCQTSKDGKTLWCYQCYQQLKKSCFYCQKGLQFESRYFIYPASGKIVCGLCRKKVHELMCFTCSKKIEKV